MGWNNERKKEALQKQRQKLLQDQKEGAELEDKGRRKLERLQKDVRVQQCIMEHEGFATINTAEVQRNIRKIEESIAELEGSNDQLKALNKQLDEFRLHIKEWNDKRDSLVGSRSTVTEKLKQMETGLEQLHPLIETIREEDKDGLLRFQQQHAMELAGVQLDSLQGLYEVLREAADKAVQTALQEQTSTERAVLSAINQLKSPSADVLQHFPDWAADVQSLPREVAYAQEYVEWLDRLESDNLPRYRQEFERLLHDTAVHKIGLLNEELDQWERKIKLSIDTLNQSLSAIQFNRLPDTFIRLEYRSVPDSTIKEFRTLLLAALPNQRAWQQSPFEEKEAHFKEQVQPLITMLDASESYRSRVLDVRNWFEFWATELYRATGELKKAYRQMGQLSGGEKAQLTYTILCSAIAYQFGITMEGQNARSMRFIAVDESFSNQDEEKATYLMELCRQLHLQLLVVTPSDKIQVVESFIAHVHLVQRRNSGESVLFNMTKKELQQHREALATGEALPV